MKRLFIAASMLFGFAVAASAQKTVTTATAAKPAKVVALKKPATVKPTAIVMPTETTAHPKKADGTADMRFKANKTAKTAPVAGPKKADGTPDMRFKANKPVKAVKPVTPVKKAA